MKNVHIVILCFSAFVLLFGSILGYGLWRNRVAAKEAQQRVAAADHLLSTSLADFVRQTPAEQTGRLVEARMLKQALEAAQAGSPDDRTRDLGEWIARHLALRVAVHGKRRQLAKLREELQCGAPAPVGVGPCRQVSSATAQRIRAAAKRADEIAGDLTVRVGGKQVDLSPAVGEEALRVQAEARRAVMELDLREKAFIRFAEGMERSQKAKRFDEVRGRVPELNQWFSCVVDSGEKQRRLKEIERKLAIVRGREGMEKTLHARIDGLLAALRASRTAKEIAVIQVQCDDVGRAAKDLVDIFPDSKNVREKMKQLREARAAAMRRLHDLARRAQIEKQKQDIIDKSILYKIHELTNSGTTRPAWHNAVGPIRQAIEDVRRIDPNTQFFAILLDATKPMPAAQPHQRKSAKWVGPKWEFFDDNIKGFKELAQLSLRHSRKLNREKYEPIKGYSAILARDQELVALKFGEIHAGVVAYLKKFEEFKKNHERRVARKQTAEDAKHSTSSTSAPSK